MKNPNAPPVLPPVSDIRGVMEHHAVLEKRVADLEAQLERLQRCFPAAMLRDLEILAGEKQ
jgi:hypothetical protein